VRNLLIRTNPFWQTVALVAAAFSLGLPLCQSAEAQTTKPNIILIMADDFGYECVTANGGESYQTPVLDKLASEGVRFTQCHVQPLCTPTRVQLMTGRYNVRNYLNFGTLLKTEKTFANVLRDAGYATGICGKWQLGREKELPQHFGFDESCLWQHTRRPPRYANPGLEYNGVEKDFTKGEYGPTLVNDFALDFITRHKEKPFFLYYPMMLTHDPFQPTPDSPDWDPKTTGEQAKRDVKHFADMTAYMDKMIGQVVAKLDDLGLRENTMLVFLGDNGTGRGVTSRFKGADYPGGKGSTTVRGTHVPLMVSWPAVIKEAKVSHDLISSVDLLPTLCQAVGAPVPANVDGVSFLPQLRGEKGIPREWLYTWYSPRQGADMTVRECAFDEHFKLYHNGDLYDLIADPDEKKPLGSEAAGAADAAVKLRTALEKFKDARPTELDKAFTESGVAKPKKGKGKKNQQE
jgi:arylsulfatase A